MKETKTAEEALGETYAALLGSIKDFIISAIEVYAEQARREAINSLHIEIHNKIVETRVELYKATQNEIVDRKLYDLDIFIGQKADAAAGYDTGKEES